jgi:hypothetical protein
LAFLSSEIFLPSCGCFMMNAVFDLTMARSLSDF